MYIFNPIPTMISGNPISYTLIITKGSDELEIKPCISKTYVLQLKYTTAMYGSEQLEKTLY